MLHIVSRVFYRTLATVLEGELLWTGGDLKPELFLGPPTVVSAGAASAALPVGLRPAVFCLQAAYLDIVEVPSGSTFAGLLLVSTETPGWAAPPESSAGLLQLLAAAAVCSL